jgi:hypothetical protein
LKKRYLRADGTFTEWETLSTAEFDLQSIKIHVNNALVPELVELHIAEDGPENV